MSRGFCWAIWSLEECEWRVGFDLGFGRTCMLSGISEQLDRKLMALLAPFEWRQASLLAPLRSMLKRNNGEVLDLSMLGSQQVWLLMRPLVSLLAMPTLFCLIFLGSEVLNLGITSLRMWTNNLHSWKRKKLVLLVLDTFCWIGVA